MLARMVIGSLLLIAWICVIKSKNGSRMGKQEGIFQTQVVFLGKASPGIHFRKFDEAYDTL